jgi:two-component system NarL family response regulator
MTIEILLVKKINLITEGICASIKNNPQLTLIGTAEDQLGALQFCSQHQPDVLILCLELQNHGMSGFIRQVLAKYPTLKIVGLSARADTYSAQEMLSAGIMAYISIERGTQQELAAAIHAVMSGRGYICQDMLSKITLNIQEKSQNTYSNTKGLGNREEQILKLIADGYRSKEIAQRLSISPSTVDVHRRNIKRKTGLCNVAELTKYAIRKQIALV